MRLATIAKSFTFDAAHQLPNHDGKCRHLHGHTYRVDVLVKGPVRAADESSSEGMVMDFGDLKAAWRPIHEQVDHAFLNDVLPKDYLPTTAENIAFFVLDALRATVPGVVAVRIWETPTSSAEAA